MSELEAIAAQRPKDVDEAIPCIQRALRYFHEHDDYRAVFLRAYYITTLNIHAAVHQLADYEKQIFFDPEWVSALAGKFSALYFRSLTTFDRDPDSERAWKLAHKTAEEKTGTVVQDLMLGLNAHINYDLAYAAYLNMKEHGDERDHLLLPRRKFDHDQVNNVLVRTAPQVAAAITRDYGGGIAVLRTAMHRIDDMLTETGLKYYRERVWWTAISYLTTTDDEEVNLVHERLNWESGKVAKLIADESIWSLPIRTIGVALRRKHFGAITLENPADVAVRPSGGIGAPFTGRAPFPSRKCSGRRRHRRHPWVALEEPGEGFHRRDVVLAGGGQVAA